MADKINASKFVYKKNDSKDPGYRNSSYFVSASNFNAPSGPAPYMINTFNHPQQLQFAGSGIPYPSGGGIMTVFPQHINQNGASSGIHGYFTSPANHPYKYPNDFDLKKKQAQEDESFLMSKKAELLQSFRINANPAGAKRPPEQSSLFSQTRIINNYGSINIGVAPEPKVNVYAPKPTAGGLEVTSSSPSHKKTRSLAEISKKIDRMINLNNQMKDSAGLMGSQKGTPRRDMTSSVLEIGGKNGNGELWYSKSHSNPPELANLVKEHFYHSAKDSRPLVNDATIANRGYNSHNPDAEKKKAGMNSDRLPQREELEIAPEDFFRNHHITIEGDLDLLKKISIDKINKSEPKVSTDPQRSKEKGISAFCGVDGKGRPGESSNIVDLQAFRVEHNRQRRFQGVGLSEKIEAIRKLLEIDAEALIDEIYAKALLRTGQAESSLKNEIATENVVSTSNMLLMTDLFPAKSEEKLKSRSMHAGPSKNNEPPAIENVKSASSTASGASHSFKAVKISNEQIEKPHQSIIKVISPESKILEETCPNVERPKRGEGPDDSEVDSFELFTKLEVSKALSGIYNKVMFKSVSKIQEKNGMEERRKTYLEEFIRTKEDVAEPKIKKSGSRRIFTGEFYREEVEKLAKDIESKAPLRRVYEDFEKSRPQMFITIENLNMLYDNTLMMLITNRIDNKLLDEEANDEDEDVSPVSFSNRSSFEDRPRLSLNKRVSFMEEIIGTSLNKLLSGKMSEHSD